MEHELHIIIYSKEEKSYLWDFHSKRYEISDLNDWKMITKFIDQVMENNKILEEIFEKAENK